MVWLSRFRTGARLRTLALMTHIRHLAWRLAEPPPLLPPLAIQSLKVAIACGLAWWLLAMSRRDALKMAAAHAAWHQRRK